MAAPGRRRLRWPRPWPPMALTLLGCVAGLSLRSEEQAQQPRAGREASHLLGRKGKSAAPISLVHGHASRRVDLHGSSEKAEGFFDDAYQGAKNRLASVADTFTMGAMMVGSTVQPAVETVSSVVTGIGQGVASVHDVAQMVGTQVATQVAQMAGVGEGVASVAGLDSAKVSLLTQDQTLYTQCRTAVSNLKLKQARSAICGGEVNASPSNRQAGLEHPLECLTEKLERIYGKMCEMCSQDKLDAQVSIGLPMQGTLPCAGRYKALSRIAQKIEAGDDQIAMQLRKTATLLVQLAKSFPNTASGLDEALTNTGGNGASVSNYLQKLKLEKVIDGDGDGNLTFDEIKSYLQAVYPIAEVAPEVIVEGKVTPEGLAKWADERMLNWLQFYTWGGGTYKIV